MPLIFLPVPAYHSKDTGDSTNLAEFRGEEIVSYGLGITLLSCPDMPLSWHCHGVVFRSSFSCPEASLQLLCHFQGIFEVQFSVVSFSLPYNYRSCLWILLVFHLSLVFSLSFLLTFPCKHISNIQEYSYKQSY